MFKDKMFKDNKRLTTYVFFKIVSFIHIFVEI